MRALAVIFFSAVGCAVGFGLLAGCGSIGEPLYPALRIPSRVADLTVLERGSNLDVTFTIPPLTTEGLALTEIGGVELRVGPPPSNGWNVDEWIKTSTHVDVPTPEKPGPVQAAIPAGKFVDKDVVVSVRVTNPKGRDAGWSEFRTIEVKQPVPDPTNFHVAAGPQGVDLTWNAALPSQFRIFRKAGQAPKPALLATVMENNYVDISAEYGKDYQYSVQALRGMAESEVVGPVSITPIDTFPPAVPTGLTLSVGVGAAELAWTRNTETDFKEYRVLRSEERGPFVEIARGLEAPTYSDRTLQSGKQYRYQVLAIDQVGNVSAPCDPVEINAP
jgi:hypothetical protein